MIKENNRWQMADDAESNRMSDDSFDCVSFLFWSVKIVPDSPIKALLG